MTQMSIDCKSGEVTFRECEPVKPPTPEEIAAFKAQVAEERRARVPVELASLDARIAELVAAQAELRALLK